jgi:hypothetical protein
MPTIGRHTALGLLSGLALGVVIACEHAGFAPEGAVVRLHSASDSIGEGGDSTIIEAALFLEAGDLVPYRIKVTFSSAEGTMCAIEEAAAQCADSLSSHVSALTLETSSGVARVSLRSGPRPGTATVRAQSGDARDSIQIKVGAGEEAQSTPP